VTLSKHPIVGGGFFPFSDASFSDSLVSKGALKTTIELADGVRTNLWNVHLQAGDADGVRSRQVSQLLSWVQHAEDGQVADLVGGDFNCTADSAEYKRLAELLGHNSLQLGGIAPFPTYDGLSGNINDFCSLDYLFVRPHPSLTIMCAVPRAVFAADDLRLSDHMGVAVELNFVVEPGFESGSSKVWLTTATEKY
jgi:endonuclease/exonuclease/phosphatase family metal-dependent hydrolase